MLQAEWRGTQPVEGSGNHARSGGLEQGKMEKKTQSTGMKQADRILFEGLPLTLCGDHTEEGTGR